MSMQAPPASVPFVEYVLKAIEHPPFMFVSKLAACCTMLFLTRSDPELLRTLCFKWAVRFQRDRTKLIAIMRRRSQVCKPASHSAPACSICGGGGGLDAKPRPLRDAASADARADDEVRDNGCSGEGPGDEESGHPLCNPDDAVEHFLKILNSLVSMYFSWNWHRTDYVIQVNKEYEAYVRENILPICVATPVEDGLDDEEETPWLLSPSEYLSGPASSIGNFYSPVSRRESRTGGGGLLPSPPSELELLHQPIPKKLSTELDAETSPHFADGVSGVTFVGGSSGGGALQKFAADDRIVRNPCPGSDVSDCTALPTGGGVQCPTSLDAGIAGSDGGCGCAPCSRSLSFVTLANFREALEANTHGLVIIFHAKYSAKSNEVVGAFQDIVQHRRLHPMPDIAVIYTVAEPELAALYNVSWFPTIVYTPPPTAQSPPQGLSHRQPSTRAKPDDSSVTPAADAPAAAAAASSSTPVDRHPSVSDADASPHSTPTGGVNTPTPAARRSASSTLGVSTNTTTNITTGCYANNGSRDNLCAGGVTIPAPAAGPSPTQVLYGFVVEKDTPSASPKPTRLSPTTRGVPQYLTPTAATPFGSAGGEDGAALSGCATGRGSNPTATSAVAGPAKATAGADAATGPAGGIHPNRSCSSLSMFGDNDVATCELEDAIAHDGHRVYPMNGVVSVASLVDWVSSKGTATPKIKKIKDFVTRVSALRAEQKYKKFRELHSAVVMLRRLQAGGGKETTQRCCSASADTSDSGGDDGKGGGGPQSSMVGTKAQTRALAEETHANGGDGRVGCVPSEPPLFIFLGGGMAAGKSTAAMALAHSAWWRSHKDQSVLVNADEFKVTEPAFDGMQAEVHSKSTRVAENLLVQAINQGRSIVFDGTMMWAPFVQQVVDMVRDAHLRLYKQGPGYRGPGKKEEYFLPSEVRPAPLPCPYVIRFLGITVEPEIAVPRGFLRKFSTGRGVPITTQLRSFKMFAENFALYARMVDSATLYNNNVFVDLEKGELPPIMAERDKDAQDGEFTIHDEAAYQLFMKQKTLNENADNILELYPAVSPTSSSLLTGIVSPTQSSIHV